MLDSDRTEYLRGERRAAKNAAQIFTRACQTGDVETFYVAVDQINLVVGGWLLAMRKVVREVRVVSPGIQAAFHRVWTESKMLSLDVGNHRVLCGAARLLLPKYSGPAVRLFRGAAAVEAQRRTYGLAWSTDVKVAEKFALGRRVMDSGSVLLETLAAPEAIISEINSTPRREIKKLRRMYPDRVFEENYNEHEYVVDRRYLNAVSVVRRYEQSSLKPRLPK
jgi:hypothetical protein